MNTTSSGAVGFAPVGTFVKDLALELGKSASTVAAYIKKHLPEALVKRKNANNRLANFAFEQAVEAVRAHYSPKAADNSLLQELERLRARVRELEKENAELKKEQQPKKRKLGALLDDLHSQQQQSSFLVDRQGHRLNNLRLKEQGLRQLTFEEYRSQSNESVQKNQATATRDREFTEGKPKVIDIFRRIKGSD